MILEISTIDALKAEFATFGVVWPEEVEPSQIRPVTKAQFRNWVIAIYKDGTDVAEIKAVSGDTEEFNALLLSLLGPPDDNRIDA